MSRNEGTHKAGKAKVYPDETKAAVMAALLTGQSISSVATEYRVPEGTIRAWKHRAVNPVARDVAASEHPKPDIASLLFDYLEASLQTLRAQVIAFRDPAWLSQQNAADAAVLHGVLTDKAVRLLEALGGPNP